MEGQKVFVLARGLESQALCRLRPQLLDFPRYGPDLPCSLLSFDLHWLISNVIKTITNV